MTDRFVKASAVAILIAASAIGGARADDPPLRKAGLWEVTIDAGERAMVARQCVDDASQKALMGKGKATLESLCSKHESSRRGDVDVHDSVCKIMGSQQISHSETTHVGDNEFKTVATTRFDPPLMGRAESTSTITGKWLGPCGADLAPGEMLVNGNKIKIPTQP